MPDNFEVRWSSESARRTDQIIKYLFENWTEREVKNFLLALEGFEEIVSRFPHIYPPSNQKKGHHRAVIMKQISILYSLERNIIKVHTLFDNRQDPSKLK